jgi:hypothetical protein
VYWRTGLHPTLDSQVDARSCLGLDGLLVAVSVMLVSLIVTSRSLLLVVCVGGWCCSCSFFLNVDIDAFLGRMER